MGNKGMKGLEEYPGLKQYKDNLGPGLFDFYRCYKCARLITREEEQAWKKKADASEEDIETFCPCGSLKIFPARRPVRLDWFSPGVLRYTTKVILARGLAPWCDKHLRSALPLIERIVRPKEA